tara:strand:+ start:296 stop:463 length:168 start_codon:yes stop_codon:yes gene_type:complete
MGRLFDKLRFAKISEMREEGSESRINQGAEQSSEGLLNTGVSNPFCCKSGSNSDW